MNKMQSRLTLVSLGFIAAFLVVTGWTPETSFISDSYYYAGAAESIAKGLGSSYIDKTTGELAPLIHYPPLTSAVAAIPIILLQMPTSLAFMIVSAISLALITILVFRQSNGKAPGSSTRSVFALASVLSIICSKQLLEIFQMQLSEPLFLLILVTECTLVHAFINSDKPALLVFTALATSLAFLTRYVGVFLVISTSLLLMTNTRKPLLRRFRDVVIYGAIFSIFFFGWFTRNYLMSGRFSSHEMTEGAGSRVAAAIYQSTLFVLPGSFPGWIRIPAFLGFVVFALVLLVRLPKPAASGSRPLQTVYVTTAIVYLLFQLAMCFNVTTRLATRTLLPFFVPLFVGFSIAVCDRLALPSTNKNAVFLRTCALVFITGFAALSFVRTIEHIHQNRTATISNPGYSKGTVQPPTL